MLPNGTVWWTDDRVQEIVDPAYVHSHLRPDEQELLKRPPFGDELTDNTYLDWILTKARRFFLVLVATGVPDQIFGILDDSYDDDDLPIPEESVGELRLSFAPDAVLNKRFYRTQFRFLTRMVGDGEHIPYADEEIVPVQPLGLKSVVNGHKDGVDKVKILTNAHVFVRRKITLDKDIQESDILIEIANAKRYAHPHCLSVFGSYTHQGVCNVLSLPAAEYSLKAFLTDIPKAFDSLDKTIRHRTLLNWPHCLASALSWLHANQQPQGGIRPSNIIVDSNFNISFGPIEGPGLLCALSKPDDVETYQYGPPERWKRAVTVQSRTVTGSLPSGGRSMMKFGRPPTRLEGRIRKPSTEESSDLKSYAYRSTSKGTFARLRLSAAIDLNAIARPMSRSESHEDTSDSQSLESQQTIKLHNSVRARTASPFSTVNSSSNSSGSSDAKSQVPQPLFIAGPESRAAVVQTWQSAEHDVFASDVFSLGAVTLDIITVLCKKTCGSFTRHRSSKNRSAGRGGGLADASFHANLGQVMTWAQSLQTEAQKKSKKDGGQSLSVVGPVLQITVQCLERGPEARPKSDILAKKLEEYLVKFGDMKTLHCYFQPLPETARKASVRKERPASRMAASQGRYTAPDLLNGSSDIVDRKNSQPTNVAATSKFDANVDAYGNPISTSESEVTSSRKRFARPHTRSDPRLDSIHSQATSIPPCYNDLDEIQVSTPTLPPATTFSQPVKINSKRRWQNWHNNDSAIDPRLSVGDQPSGGFTYLSTSASTSHSSTFTEEEGEEDKTIHDRTNRHLHESHVHPVSKPPDRGLPPLPATMPKHTKTRSNTGTKMTPTTTRVPKSDDPSPASSQPLGYSQIRPQTSQTFDLEALKQWTISDSITTTTTNNDPTTKCPTTPKEQIMSKWPVPPALDEEQAKIIQARSESRSHSRSRPTTPKSSGKRG